MTRFKLSLLAGLLFTSSFSAMADTAQNGDQKDNNWASTYQSAGMLDSVSPSDLEAAMKRAQALKADMLKQDPSKINPATLDTFQNAARKADDIADETLQKNRREVAQLLGINPDGNATMYYFVSWSMPVNLIRSYVVDAMWSGAVVVFKGVPPGKDLGEFITQDMPSLVYGKSAANISIDPRLFDRFEVKTVPSIVLATSKENFNCKGYQPVSFDYKEDPDSKEAPVTLQYDSCPPADASTYYKMSGSVSGSYMLQTLVDGGVKEAEPFLNAIRKGWADGKVPSKDQSAFNGEWESVLTPEQLKAIANVQETQGIKPINSSVAP